MGGIVRKILGLDVQRRGHENISTVVLEGKEEQIKELCVYYGTSVSKTDVAQVAQVAKEEKEMKEIEDIFDK